MGWMQWHLMGLHGADAAYGHSHHQSSTHLSRRLFELMPCPFLVPVEDRHSEFREAEEGMELFVFPLNNGCIIIGVPQQIIDE